MEISKKIEELQEALGKYRMSPVAMAERRDRVISVYTAILAEKMAANFPKIAESYEALVEENERLEKENAGLDDDWFKAKQELHQAREDARKMQEVLQRWKAEVEMTREKTNMPFKEELYRHTVETLSSLTANYLLPTKSHDNP